METVINVQWRECRVAAAGNSLHVSAFFSQTIGYPQPSGPGTALPLHPSAIPPTAEIDPAIFVPALPSHHERPGVASTAMALQRGSNSVAISRLLQKEQLMEC